MGKIRFSIPGYIFRYSYPVCKNNVSLWCEYVIEKTHTENKGALYMQMGTWWVSNDLKVVTVTSGVKESV